MSRIGIWIFYIKNILKGLPYYGIPYDGGIDPNRKRSKEWEMHNKLVLRLESLCKEWEKRLEEVPDFSVETIMAYKMHILAIKDAIHDSYKMDNQI